MSILAADGVSFAIPVDTAKQVIFITITIQRFSGDRTTDASRESKSTLFGNQNAPTEPIHCR